jgi:diadenosine tetraphosphate (Ap4A) HIT family hydrolase
MTTLHPQLAQDTVELGRFPLCRVLLMRDANYPWALLVPDRDGVSEIFQLSEADQQQLMRESSFLARSLENEFAGDKLNIAALGNIVPQLHVHHIVRYKTDAAWPAPVWGRVPALAYDESELRALAKKLSDVLQNDSTIEFKPV